MYILKGEEAESRGVLLVVLVVVLLFIVTFSLGMIQTATGNEGLYNMMANPLVWTAGEVVDYGTEKFVNTCNNFLDEVESIFIYDKLERECSNWYSNCAEYAETSPQNPWTKPQLSEKDLEAMQFLSPECKTPAIETMIEEWEEESPIFSKKDEIEQYNLIRNACGSTLVKRIYRE